ncbi:hypothetical protein CLOP_g7543 [Closterium sp. NIES-67]|nr:hypothetical protein CLOP_g7543 [Closterium sp. NIES-67]
MAASQQAAMQQAASAMSLNSSPGLGSGDLSFAASFRDSRKLRSNSGLSFPQRENTSPWSLVRSPASSFSQSASATQTRAGGYRESASRHLPHSRPSNPLLVTPEGQQRGNPRHSRYSIVAAAAGAGSTKAAAKDEGGEEDLKQAHKLFDQVVIFVKAGDGGNGAVLHPPRPWKAGETPGLKGGKLNAREAEELRRKLRRKETEKAKAMKRVGSFKRDADGLAIVPMGGHGGDIVIYADPTLSTLLPLHRKKRHVARSGGHVDAKGGLARRVPDGLQGPVLRIGVPVGTVVKRKRGGKFLADLASPGDEVVVARGGRGGISVYEVPSSNKAHLRPVKAPAGTTVMTAPEDKVGVSE